MPIIEEQNPLGAALGAAGQVLLAKRANDTDNRNFLLQKAESDARTRAADAEASINEAGVHDNRVLHGLDPESGKPIDPGVGDVGAHATLDDQFKNLILKANAYQKQGAYDLANQLFAQADRVQVQLHQAKQDAIAYMREADNRMRVVAQAQHWSAQEKEQARHNMSDESIKIRNGSLSYDAAMARVGATLQAAQMHVNATERGQDIAHGDRQAALKALTKRYDTGEQGNRGKASTSKTGLTQLSQADMQGAVTHLPGPVQKVLLGLWKSGTSREGLIQTIQSAQSLSPEMKQQAIQKLQGPPALPKVNLDPGRSALLRGAGMSTQPGVTDDIFNDGGDDGDNP